MNMQIRIGEAICREDLALIHLTPQIQCLDFSGMCPDLSWRHSGVLTSAGGVSYVKMSPSLLKGQKRLGVKKMQSVFLFWRGMVNKFALSQCH